jgi:hypothetical protein
LDKAEHLRKEKKDNHSEERDRSSSPRSRSSSRESLPGDKNSATAAKRIGNKRKKMAQRNMLLSSLNAQEREKKEKAVFCLENEFARIWRQKRHNKRMRAILDYESIFRARLIHVFGLALLVNFEKDLVAKAPNVFRRGASISDFSKIIPTRNALSYAENTLIPATIPFQRSFDINLQLPSNFDTRAIPDILQYFVQSIVLASRAGRWTDVYCFSQKLWNTTQFLTQSGIMATDAGWKQEFWRAYYIVGECLLDLVDNVHIVKEELNIADDCKPATASEIGVHQKSRIKDESLEAFARSSYACKWYDMDQRHQIECIIFLSIFENILISELDFDLCWVGQVLVFVTNTLNFANKFHRLQQFSARFNNLFNHIYQPLLNFTEYNGDKSCYSALLKCRTLTDKYMKMVNEDSLDRKQVALACIDALEFYEIALNQSEQTQQIQLRAEICHEYADLLYIYGQIEAAALFWDRCTRS